MIIIYHNETNQINQVIWADKLPEGLELGSDESYLVVQREIDEHRLHQCLMRLDEEGRLEELVAPIKIRLLANKLESRLGIPILQDVHYFEINADGVDELTLSLELEAGVPAWVETKLLQQKLRVWRLIDGGGEESFVLVSQLKDHTWSLKSAEPREWFLCFDNWMTEPVNIMARAR